MNSNIVIVVGWPGTLLGIDSIFLSSMSDEMIFGTFSVVVLIMTSRSCFLFVFFIFCTVCVMFFVNGLIFVVGIQFGF